jgi:hypothetical protein
VADRPVKNHSPLPADAHLDGGMDTAAVQTDGALPDGGDGGARQTPFLRILLGPDRGHRVEI